MRFRAVVAAAACLAIAACGSSDPGSGSSEAATDAPAGGEAPAPASGAAPVQVSLPRIAYVYRLGFRLPGEAIARAQEQHVQQCERLGPARCQLVGMARSGGEQDHVTASTKLRVASDIARTFSASLTRTVADAGGRAVDTAIEAEDVSKQMVDAEARIRQRELLVQRLTEILRTRTGKVSELVEAERSVAEAQEELDQAKGWLTELRGRVAMSTMELSYTSSAVEPGSFFAELRDAVRGSGATFVIGLSMLVTVAIFLLPWAIAAIPIVLIVRWYRRRRRHEAEPPAQG